MKTFKDLLDQYMVAQQRVRVLKHLMDIMSLEFMGENPKKVLLDELGVKVPSSAWEDTYNRLGIELQKSEEEAKVIQDTVLTGDEDGRVIDQD